MTKLLRYILPFLLIFAIEHISAKNPATSSDREKKVEKFAQYSQPDLSTQRPPYSKAECINKCLGERIVFTRPKRLLYTYAHFRKNLILIKNAYFIKHYTMAHNHKPFYIQTPFECNNSCDYFIFNLHRVII